MTLATLRLAVNRMRLLGVVIIVDLAWISRWRVYGWRLLPARRGSTQHAGERPRRTHLLSASSEPVWKEIAIDQSTSIAECAGDKIRQGVSVLMLPEAVDWTKCAALVTACCRAAEEHRTETGLDKFRLGNPP